MKYPLNNLISWIVLIWGTFEAFGLPAMIMAAAIHASFTWAVMSICSVLEGKES